MEIITSITQPGSYYHKLVLAQVLDTDSKKATPMNIINLKNKVLSYFNRHQSVKKERGSVPNELLRQICLRVCISY